MDFFGMIPDNFFSLLASKNKRIYLASIIQSFKTYETGSILGIEKRIVVDDLVNFLENSAYLYDVEDEDDEESNPQSKRELANYILRRMEECGWIYVDVTNDYEEILNFSDIAITICEALINAYPFDVDSYEEDSDNNYEEHINEYQGYIYTIYSILNNPDNGDYVTKFNAVYNNTKQLIRALRRLDSRLKEYINSVVETSEVKELMERLMTFKTEVYDRSYLKMKTSDNINRYRLSIVSKLEELANDEFAMMMIVNDFKRKYPDDLAMIKASRAVDEIIDVFNSIDSFVLEIDNKNRTYINSTIGKIKFLLSEDDNIIGKLNTVLKHIKKSNEKGKIDKAMRLVDTMYTFNYEKVYNQESSLYTPRGTYSRNYNQMLDALSLDFTLTDDFLKQFKSAYNEVEIKNFLEANMVEDTLQASHIIDYNSKNITVLMTVYSLMYSANLDYDITILDNIIDHKKYRLKDFMIKRRG